MHPDWQNRKVWECFLIESLSISMGNDLLGELYLGLMDIDWDLEIDIETFSGSIALKMMDNYEAWELIIEKPEFQEKFLQTNWDAMPKAGVDAGKSIAWLMTLTHERQQLVRENSNFQEKFLSCNWNVAPPGGLYAGKSIAWFILIYPELSKLLVEHSKISRKIPANELGCNA